MNKKAAAFIRDEYERERYDRKSYKVRSVTDPNAVVETLRVHFEGRGPFGVHFRDIHVSTVLKKMEAIHGKAGD
jgi:hypothetical protein